MRTAPAPVHAMTRPWLRPRAGTGVSRHFPVDVAILEERVVGPMRNFIEAEAGADANAI